MVQRDSLFRLAAAVPTVGALFHFAAIVIPAFGAMAYPPTYPELRHVAFILVDAALAFLLLRRPIWLIWPTSILTLQVLNGHGRSVWRSLIGPGRIDWISVATVIGTLLVFALLFVEWRERR